jgi:hypothetical protein
VQQLHFTIEDGGAGGLDRGKAALFGRDRGGTLSAQGLGMPMNHAQFPRLMLSAGMLALLAPGLTGCFTTASGDDDSAACSSDNDCKRSQVCVNKSCVAASESNGGAPPSTGSGGSSNSTTGGSGGSSSPAVGTGGSSTGGSSTDGGSTGGSKTATGGAANATGGSSSSAGGSSNATGGSSSGAGGSSNATGGSSGSAGGSTTPACNAPVSSGAITLSTGYLSPSVIGDGGFAYTFADADGSTACVDDAALCASGTTTAYTSTGSVWGAALGFHLNQANSDAASVGSYPATSTSGLTYAVNALPSQGLRLQVDDGGVTYCVPLTSASGSVSWSQFNSACWDESGTYMTAGPSTATQVDFIVPAGSKTENFDFCVTKIAFTTGSTEPPPTNTTPLGVGSACTSNAQCASGVCSGWCTAGCSQNTDCGINSYGQLDWCIEDAASIDSCFPGCETNADCAVYGSNVICQPATATNGSSTLVCAASS